MIFAFINNKYKKTEVCGNFSVTGSHTTHSSDFVAKQWCIYSEDFYNVLI